MSSRSSSLSIQPMWRTRAQLAQSEYRPSSEFEDISYSASQGQPIANLQAVPNSQPNSTSLLCGLKKRWPLNFNRAQAAAAIQIRTVTSNTKTLTVSLVCGIVGGIALLTALSLLIFKFFRRRRSERSERSREDAEADPHANAASNVGGTSASRVVAPVYATASSGSTAPRNDSFMHISKTGRRTPSLDFISLRKTTAPFIRRARSLPVQDLSLDGSIPRGASTRVEAGGSNIPRSEWAPGF